MLHVNYFSIKSKKNFKKFTLKKIKISKKKLNPLTKVTEIKSGRTRIQTQFFRLKVISSTLQEIWKDTFF